MMNTQEKSHKCGCARRRSRAQHAPTQAARSQTRKGPALDSHRPVRSCHLIEVNAAECRARNAPETYGRATIDTDANTRAGAAHSYRTRASTPCGFLFPLRSALFVRALRRFLLRFSLAVHALAHGVSFGAVSL